MNTCENCGNKGKGHGEHPCVACVNCDKWVPSSMTMREEAMRFFASLDKSGADDITVCGVTDIDAKGIEKFYRAAVVEGMRRAADACEEYQGSAETCAIVIRAEAERIKG